MSHYRAVSACVHLLNNFKTIKKTVLNKTEQIQFTTLLWQCEHVLHYLFGAISLISDLCTFVKLWIKASAKCIDVNVMLKYLILN